MGAIFCLSPEYQSTGGGTQDVSGKKKSKWKRSERENAPTKTKYKTLHSSAFLCFLSFPALPPPPINSLLGLLLLPLGPALEGRLLQLVPRRPRGPTLFAISRFFLNRGGKEREEGRGGTEARRSATFLTLRSLESNLSTLLSCQIAMF